MAFPNSVVYMDDSIKSDVDNYREEFPIKIWIWLRKVYSYFDFYYKLGDLPKRMYHLFRIGCIMENYKAKGSFSLDLNEDARKLISDFKRSKSRELYRPAIREALDFIYMEAYSNGHD